MSAEQDGGAVMEQVGREGEDSPRSVLLDVANAMVRVFKEQFGRGPTKARASWTTSDVLTVVLEDTFTPAERNLAAMGEHERLRNIRSFFQYASVRDFCDPVERLTGRRVRAFISGIDTAAGEPTRQPPSNHGLLLAQWDPRVRSPRTGASVEKKKEAPLIPNEQQTGISSSTSLDPPARPAYRAGSLGSSAAATGPRRPKIVKAT
jgi:uncharacterized protein YbcI